MIERYLRFCWEHPARLLTFVAACTVLLCVTSFGRLGFSAEPEALFTVSAQEKAKLLEFEQRFGGWNDLVIVLEGGTLESRQASVEKLGVLLASLPYVTDLRTKLQLKGIDGLGLYFLSLEELTSVERAISDHAPILDKMSRQGWYGFLELMHERGGKPNLQAEEASRFAAVWKQAVDGRGAGSLDELFPDVKLPQAAYYLDGPTRHLVFCRSEQPLVLKAALKQRKAEFAFQGDVILTGQPLLQAEEKTDTLRDATLSTVLAIIVVQLILIAGFKETARPRLAFLSLLFGMAWSVSWAAFAVGKLNIITVNFLSITVGLGVDFSIHILARYSEEKLEGSGSVPAMVRTLKTTGLENLIGAAATSVAFWALAMTDFLAVRQLGMITGVAVPLCFVSVVTLLPPLLFLREQSKSGRASSQPPAPGKTNEGILEIERLLRRHPHQSLLCFGVLVLLMASVGSSVRFDYNLLNLQSQSSEAIRYEQKGGFNSLMAFVVADTPQQARELKLKLLELTQVSQVLTVAELIPEASEKKRPLVQSIVDRVAQISPPVFQPEREPDWERLQILAESLKDGGEQRDWVEYLKRSGPGPVEDVWRQMQVHLKGELESLIARLTKQNVQFDLGEWREQNPDLQRWSNADGKTLLQIQSKGCLWERDVLDRFLTQVDSVTTEGIGPPYLIRSYLDQLRLSYFEALRYAVLAIVLLLALHFRALVPTFIALVPKLVGAVGMFFAMAVAGIDLNPANCMALPLTLGIGLVFGIHAVHRCLESPDALLMQGATGRAIALSGLTTIASFGALMVAAHRGVFSLGFVMASGVTANMLATYLLVPPLVVIFYTRRNLPDGEKAG